MSRYTSHLVSVRVCTSWVVPLYSVLPQVAKGTCWLSGSLILHLNIYFIFNYLYVCGSGV